MRLNLQARLSRVRARVVLSFLSLLSAGNAEPRVVTEREADDLLGTLVVEATHPTAAPRRAMRIAIEPSLDASEVDVLVHSVVARDFELSGEFAQLAASKFPDGAYRNDAPPDMEAWRATGVEAVVRLQGRTARGRTLLVGELYLMAQPNQVAFREQLEAAPGRIRLDAHRIADSLIGALTGHRGGFASRLTFVQTVGRERQVFVVDADGGGLRVVPRHTLVTASTFGPEETLFLAASSDNGRYRLWEEDTRTPIELSPSGSIYGIAWNDERSELALAIAFGTSVGIFRGAPGANPMRQESRTQMALHPAFSPTGKLAYVGIQGHTSRIYVDGRAVSPRALSASAPTFCNHPDGTRLVYSVGIAKRTDLVVSDERGGQRRRLTQGPGTNGYAACSPDGRLVAFFSTRTTHEGPGLYVMPLVGGRPKRISAALGGTLRWSRELPR